MVTLPFHVLQSLDESCFKPYKTTYRKERNNALVRNNHCELEKCTLLGWVDKDLNQALLRKNHEWI
jgi:hypothetical protein